LKRVEGDVDQFFLTSLAAPPKTLNYLQDYKLDSNNNNGKEMRGMHCNEPESVELSEVEFAGIILYCSFLSTSKEI
jgi:hypothetical protein